MPDTRPLVLLGGRGASSKLARQDPTFAPLYRRFGPAKVEEGRDPYAAIIESFTHQQLSLAAGRTVHARIDALCEGAITPEALARCTDDELRACGLSRPKVSFVRDLTDRVLGGRLDLAALADQPDELVIEQLTAVKGIGEWTAHMLLLFTFHRPDVLPTLDLGIVDGARLVCGLDERPSPAELEELAEAWRPVRSVACWYLWRERDRLLR